MHYSKGKQMNNSATDFGSAVGIGRLARFFAARTLLFFAFFPAAARAQAPAAEPTVQATPPDAAPIKLVQTIPMPGVHGRMDHLGIDIKGKRLFAAALDDNQNTVEVIDLKAGKRVFSIPGQSKPQGVFYSPDYKKLFVANGKESSCKIFRGDNYKLIESISLDTNANHVGYDPGKKYLYVAVGDAKSGALAIIDTRTNQHIGDIKADAHPRGVKIEKSGPRIFVGLQGIEKVAVLDRNKREQTATWPITGAEANVAWALDEGHHRLFVGSRKPPKLTVFDTESGKQLAQLEGVNGIDDLWYDSAHKFIYATGGRDLGAGFVYVYQQKDPDHYELVARVATEPNAQTSIWVPELNRLYVSASQNGSRDAEILVFERKP
jgi:DNA-binding beta-propeller fold protein YncE